MRRWQRWVVRAGVGAAALAVLLLAGAAVALHHLDAPWLKGLLRAQAERSSGKAVDWASLQVDFGKGLTLEGLVVGSAPEVLRVASIEVDATVLRGLQAVRIQGVEATVVQPNGARPSPPPSGPGKGLSAVLAELFGKAAPVPLLEVRDISFTWIHDAAIPERVSVSGLGLVARGWDVAMGSPAAPLPLELSYQRGPERHTARLDWDATLGANGQGLLVVANAALKAQDWKPELAGGPLLRFQAAARFLPGRVDVDVQRLDLLGEVGRARAHVGLNDDGAPPQVQALEGEVDLGRLAAWAAPLGLPFQLDKGRLAFHASALKKVDLEVSLGELTTHQGGVDISCGSTRVSAAVVPVGAFSAAGELKTHCRIAQSGRVWFDDPLELELAAKGREVKGRLAFALPSLERLRPSLKEASAKVQADFELQLAGAAPTVRATSVVTVENLAGRHLELSLRNHGTAVQQHAEWTLTVAEGAVSGVLDYDAQAPSLNATLSTEGARLPALVAEAKARVERGELLADVSVKASRLAALAPWMERAKGGARFDLSTLEATLAGHARLRGFGAGFKPPPASSLNGEADFDANLRNLHWFDGAQSAGVASARVAGKVHTQAQVATVDGRLTLAGVDYAHDEDAYRIDPVEMDVTASVHPATGEVSAKATAEVGRVQLGPRLAYPLEGLRLALQVERQANGVIHVPALTFENPAGGTSLELHGGAAPNETPAKLFVQGALRQDLSKLWRDAEALTAAGRAEMTFDVSSGDMSTYLTTASLKLTGAGFQLPTAGVSIEGVNGEVPLVSTFQRTPRGWAVVRAHKQNAYTALRFADQHALLGRKSYLTIQKVVTRQATLEDFAGNLKVDHNLISLEQMEMTVREGRLSGQCLLDTDANNLKLKAELRATGVMSSHQEPFDGNAALSISLKDRSVDGRAEVLRIGRRHLLDLLDLQDPLHEAPAFNRVRKALAIGYPDRVQLSFDHGFFNAHIAFGGLASLVRVDDLRGMPIEAMIDKYIKEDP